MYGRQEKNTKNDKYCEFSSIKELCNECSITSEKIYLVPRMTTKIKKSTIKGIAREKKEVVPLYITKIPKCVSKFKNLRVLSFDAEDLNVGKIKKIENLEKLEKLEYLGLDNNLIEKIEGIDNLKNLKELFLESNKIKKIENLDKLVNLETLVLSNQMDFNKKKKGIEKIENLDKLVNLKELFMTDNNIDRIEGLDNLVNLEVITLNENNIKDLGGLEHLKKLKQVYLGKGLEKTSKLKTLTHLKDLIFLSIEELFVDDVEVLDQILINNRKLNEINGYFTFERPIMNRNEEIEFDSILEGVKEIGGYIIRDYHEEHTKVRI